MKGEFYFLDRRSVLVPIEHLSPDGVSAEFAALLANRHPAGAAIASFLAKAFSLYWQRSAHLAEKLRSWPPPRLRNIAILDSTTAIPPYVQLLNTTTWTLFDCDFDATVSSVELLAYLLVHGECMSVTGEVTHAALLNAPYWFDRTEAEVAEFRRGARASTRPDSEAFRQLADALAWLRRLHHETLRPPRPGQGLRVIADSGLAVPDEIVEEPPILVRRWEMAARAAVSRYYDRYAARSDAEVDATLKWLRDEPHAFVVTGKNNRVLWDCEHPDRVGAIRHELRRATMAALDSVRADLRVIDHHSREFRSRAVRYEGLPTAGVEIAQDGYTYLLRGRKVLAYNLDEPGLDRTRVPALPYARSMLGARAYHEWCHLAVGVRWVQCSVPPAAMADRIAELRDAFDDAVSAAPQSIRQLAGVDLMALVRGQRSDQPISWESGAALVPGETGGAALVRLMLPRIADFQANLLASHFQADDEREAYVRQNIRTLRGEYGVGQTWRMFARYLYERQYLRFSRVADPWRYFCQSTWFDADFLLSGVVSEERVMRIDRAWSALLDTFAIDPAAVRLPPSTENNRGGRGA